MRCLVDAVIAAQRMQVSASMDFSVRVGMDFGRLGVVRRVCGGTGAALPLLVEGAAVGSHYVLLLHYLTTEGGDEFIVDDALLNGAWTFCFVVALGPVYLLGLSCCTWRDSSAPLLGRPLSWVWCYGFSRHCLTLGPAEVAPFPPRFASASRCGFGASLLHLPFQFFLVEDWHVLLPAADPVGSAARLLWRCLSVALHTALSAWSR